MHYIGFILALLTSSVIGYWIYSEFISKRKRYYADARTPMPFIARIDPQKIEDLDSILKGREFENGIVSRFDQHYFTLMHWRSDKTYKGIYPLSNQYPDLEYEYRDGKHIQPFAVECKWRAAYASGMLEWASSIQLENYISYQQKSRIPVFVAIGVGGTPMAPKDLFVIPLRDIKEEGMMLSYEFMSRYKKTKNRFYIDLPTMMLT